MDFEDVCIICLEEMCRKDAVWSCTTCYSDYHLVCINDWISKHRKSREQILNDEQRNLNLSDGYEMAMNRIKKLMQDSNHWSCPKCRHEYALDEAPNQYYCYCGKTTDPKGNEWLKPHTCGEKCEKFLKPYCGDICYDLCHWGPCQPCPKMLSSASCYCGKELRTAIRCSQRYWSCESQCNKKLTCGLHVCRKLCHDKNCDPCNFIVAKSCLCESQVKEVKCSEVWKCSKSCKVFDKMLLNKCPCGKMDLDQLGNGDGYKQSTCSDTCDRFLDCGTHKCVQKCHLGDCSLCRQMVSKSCRCGSSVALVMCHKEFTCNSKCLRRKSCGKHQCKRRCCDPNLPCSPCDLICNNVLSCRKHKCQMRCHVGPCYPCQKTVDVSCSCGSKQTRVACGANKEKICDLLTLKCKNPCKIRSKCRHENNHKCHSKTVECPPCVELCSCLHDCGHKCSKKCHDAVKTTIKLDKSKLAGPWEAVNDGKIIFVAQDCPPCDFKMSLICLGGHELLYYQCWQKITHLSCGRKCNRLLSCGNHYCTFECHQTSELKSPDILLNGDVMLSNSSAYCDEPCHNLCDKSMAINGCNHQCPKIKCHKDPCPPCIRYVVHKCHCGSLDLHIECQYGPSPPSSMLSCPARCSRTLSKTCNHQCPSLCHPGKCEDQNIRCKVKVLKTCHCGQIKMTIPCWKSETTNINCDHIKCDKQSEDANIRQRRVEISENPLPVLSVKRFKLSNNCFVMAAVFLICLVLIFGLYVIF